MNILQRFSVLAIFVFCFISCNYLDVVPDEKPTEKDAFEDTNAAERFMYSCYSYLPAPRSGTSSLDLMTGDEVVTAFEHETFASFPKGNYTASSPVISYWNTFFQGLRQCYIMLNNVDQVPGLPQSTRDDYVAQAKFLIAYYHFLLIRCYGPVILIKEEPSLITPPSDYLGRSPLDECIQYVCDLFDEAATGLPNTRPVRQYGLATNIAAKSLKAKMLLYAASPLFNGNSDFYSGFVNKNGTPLMPLSYDANKWVKAKVAYKEAINLAESAGHALYTNTTYNGGNLEPTDPTQHCLRYSIIEAGNKEIIWADSRGEGAYGIQNKSIPFCNGSAWNGIAPTISMLKRFYTKNGLPIDKDPEFNTSSMFNLEIVGDENALIADKGSQTLKFNLNREPRYYAWVAFQNGFYEILSAPTNGAYTDDASYQKYSPSDNKGKLVCNFVLGGNTARGSVGNLRANNYSPNGFLNKKGVDPGYAVSKSLQSPLDYPWPIIRLADLYLGYAETCMETNDLAEGKVYLNKIRERAGIPPVEISWNKIATLTQEKLRDIVRQERMIEFYLENQNFWDMRRWKLAGNYFNSKAQGMNIEAATIEEYAEVKEVIFERKFESPTQYLLPIPISDVNKNENLVQNIGY